MWYVYVKVWDEWGFVHNADSERDARRLVAAFLNFLGRPVEHCVRHVA